MNMKNKILVALNNALKKINVNADVELTEAKGHADFATNVALKNAKEYNLKPFELAQKIIKATDSNEIQKMEVAGPGFINIFLNSNAMGDFISEIIRKDNDYGKGMQNRFINIEYISANPTGFLHVGHARGAALGATLSQVLMFAGNKVDQEYWINDSGSQIDVLAEATWIRYQQLFGKKIEMPENTYRGKDIIIFAEKIKELFGDNFLNEDYLNTKDFFRNESKKIALEFIKEHIAKLDVKMDIWSSEEEVRKTSMKKYIDKLAETYEKNGALWLRTTKYGDDKDRVIRKANGEWTYFAPDIAYHNIKYDRGYDKLINIWGSDHIGYIDRVKTAIHLSGKDENALDVLTIQFVKLLKNNEELKMSKRMGTSFTLNELVELIGKDATRFNMISKSNNSTIVFDIEEVIKKTNENPVFSIQYSHARTHQLLKKSTKKPVVGQYNDKKEIDLINILAKFPEQIELVSKNYKVHLLTQYLMDVSKTFNSFYASTKIVGSYREKYLLALVKATQIVLRNCLKIIGVSAPKKM